MLHTKFHDNWPTGLRRRFLKGFYLIWAWRPPWSCDLDPTNKHSFPHPMDAPHEIWLQSAQCFQRSRCLKMLIDDRLQKTTTEASHSISSPVSQRLRWAKKKCFIDLNSSKPPIHHFIYSKEGESVMSETVRSSCEDTVKSWSWPLQAESAMTGPRRTKTWQNLESKSWKPEFDVQAGLYLHCLQMVFCKFCHALSYLNIWSGTCFLELFSWPFLSLRKDTLRKKYTVCTHSSW